MPLWVPSPGSRFQICPGLAKELEAGHAVIIFLSIEQIMKRRFAVSVVYM